MIFLCIYFPPGTPYCTFTSAVSQQKAFSSVLPFRMVQRNVKTMTFVSNLVCTKIDTDPLLVLILLFSKQFPFVKFISSCINSLAKRVCNHAKVKKIIECATVAIYMSSYEAPLWRADCVGFLFLWKAFDLDLCDLTSSVLYASFICMKSWQSNSIL